MTSWQKTGAHPFYIGMYIHIYTHIYVHKYTSQKECLHIFMWHEDFMSAVSEAANKGLLEQIRSLFCSQRVQFFCSQTLVMMTMSEGFWRLKGDVSNHPHVGHGAMDSLGTWAKEVGSCYGNGHETRTILSGMKGVLDSQKVCGNWLKNIARHHVMIWKQPQIWSSLKNWREGLILWLSLILQILRIQLSWLLPEFFMFCPSGSQQNDLAQLTQQCVNCEAQKTN